MFDHMGDIGQVFHCTKLMEQFLQEMAIKSFSNSVFIFLCNVLVTEFYMHLTAFHFAYPRVFQAMFINNSTLRKRGQCLQRNVWLAYTCSLRK